MRFEWDEAKRRANLVKHGIDFRDLGPVFEEVNRIELEDRRRDYGERRLVVFVLLRGRLLHVTYTARQHLPDHFRPQGQPQGAKVL